MNGALFLGTRSANVTIRPSTPEERKEKWPPVLAGGRRQRIPKYVVVGTETDIIVSVFGMPQGGQTRAEAVFWAKRFASKNGYGYRAPDGWENVEGTLP